MQMITHITKYLILAILSCSLVFLTWDSGNSVIVSLDSTQQYSPADDEVTPPPNETIWTTMSKEFPLDDQAHSARVKAEIKSLLADQGKLYHILKAAGPYIYYIHQQTQQRGLPAELALIPVVESEFDPYDHSTKGATGLWQLMPQTARELGVKMKAGYDGRRDVVASTKAALAYFHDLGNNFNGNWYLAIAAYNCGQGKIEWAERRTGSHSYWNLPLPQETKYYVPKLLAVAAIIKDPQKYGVQLPPISNKPYFTQEKIVKPVTMTQVAKQSGVSIKTLDKLNPDFRRKGRVPAKVANLLVPIDNEPSPQENPT